MLNPKFFLPTVLFFLCYVSDGQVLDTSWKNLARMEDKDWLGSEEALELANTVLLLQKEIGGWPKNVQPQNLTEDEKRKLVFEKDKNVGATIDNGATIQEMIFLSKVYQHYREPGFRIGFLEGLDYILEAQYESSGGWPQFYPLRKGYYSHITYNDDAMVNVLRLLREVYDSNTYAHLNIPQQKKDAAKKAFEKGIECILKTQYVQDGHLTAWCAQYDEHTLKPAKARTYELPSLSGSESAEILRLLMDMEHPNEHIIAAIEAAVAWFQKTRIDGLRQIRTYNENGKVVDKQMVQDSSAGPLWARFMELEDNTPFFCDRDGIKKYALSEIGEERRNGYKWYTDEPEQVLASFPIWRERVNLQKKQSKTIDIYNMVVAQDGSGDFTTLQEAINAAKGFPDTRVTITVKNGIYREKVEVYEWNNNMSIIGESREKTVITFDDYFDKLKLGRNSTFHTPTFLVQGNDFYMANLTIENTAGEVGQAVALSINADRVKVENCTITGNQDTLYVTGEGFKQYFANCFISGTTDFIFGQATVFFENCEIHSISNSFITAASTPQGVEYGYVFKNCKLISEPGLDAVYLGRPWRTYAKTVFLECEMGKHILPQGWNNWSNEEAEKESFYAEYRNSGPGF
ncbi:MAG: pectate lyase, partial [Maribacter sp.]